MSPASGSFASAFAPFPYTSWSLVSRARADGAESREAVEHLCQLYWPPLYAFLRRSGHKRADAEDLLQDFFTQFVEQSVFRYADQDRGRFRTFLIAAVKRFASREKARNNTKRRRPDGKQIVPLDFETAEKSFASRCRTEDSPETLFDRAWALNLLEQAREVVREEYSRAGKSELFDGIATFLTAEPQDTYIEISEKLGMTPGAARVAVHRIRQRYGAVLRRLIESSLDNGDEFEDELQWLIQIVSA